MTSFLLIISFLLHIIAFIAIYQLYKQVQTPNKQDASQETIELLDMYLAEVKEENKRLEKTLLAKKQYQSNENPMEEEVANTYTLPEVDDDVQFETSQQAKILQMHDQGLSNAEIARKLSCGKTEVELIIKLHAKNQ